MAMLRWNVPVWSISIKFSFSHMVEDDPPTQWFVTHGIMSTHVSGIMYFHCVPEWCRIYGTVWSLPINDLVLTVSLEKQELRLTPESRALQ